MAYRIVNTGIFLCLLEQLNSLAKHNRQGSYKTRERYYEAMQRFCAFLADMFRLQKLANISGKHLIAYVEQLLDAGKSASTIKTDLAAIRFFHSRISRAKYRLPSNDEMNVALERRRFGGVDRTWSQREFGRFVLLCREQDMESYAAITCITYYAGLRIHECFRLDTAAAEAALKNNMITIKGKGGKIRSVPINESIRIELRKMLDITPRGHKLFVPDGIRTDLAISRFQQFLCNHRNRVQDGDSERPLTHHGLRHTFAARTYQALIDKGVTPLEARCQVSKLLGHERPDVTKIYLASIKDGDAHA